MSKVTNIANQRFGRLLALEPNGANRHRKTMWLCRCDCGKMLTVCGNALRSGNTQSCGCKRPYHRRSTTSIWISWKNMRQRCCNQNHKNYKDYGGRGIVICDRWNSFINFLTDMGEPPPGTSLDRINNDHGYEPGNCRWATPKEQANNRRNRWRNRSATIPSTDLPRNEI